MPSGQIIFGPQNAAAHAGRICYTYVAENRRWPRPKSGHSAGNANAGLPVLGPRYWEGKNSAAPTLKFPHWGPDFGDRCTGTDTGYGTCENPRIRIVIWLNSTRNPREIVI